MGPAMGRTLGTDSSRHQSVACGQFVVRRVTARHPVRGLRRVTKTGADDLGTACSTPKSEHAPSLGGPACAVTPVARASGVARRTVPVMTATHDVANQVPPLTGHDPIAGDTVLAEACLRYADAGTLASLAELGRLAGSETAQEWGRVANENPPKLRTHDRYGHRIDEVEFHPYWHELMRTAVGNGLAGAPWADPGPHAHVRRATGYLGWTQVEMGHGCPVTMTYAVVPALRRTPDLARVYELGLTSRGYQFGLAEPSTKAGLVAGMGMTEKQGGSDVRANTTRAAARADGSFALTGHKWFTSAPMSDLFLVLAQLDEGVSCFVVPRVLPDGTRNVFRLQRLKDKLGDRSNASSEVEFDGTTGRLVGEPGRGVPTIIE